MTRSQRLTAETITVLERARDRVATAWTQGDTGETPDGACCAAVAINKGGERAVARCEAKREVKRTVDPTGRTWLSEWNDAPERTQAEVVAAFDETIARMQKEQRR